MTKILALAALAVSGAPPARAAAGWSVLEGGRFAVMTDAGEAEARRVLAGLEEIAEAMEAIRGPLPPETPPARVYLLRDAALFRRLGGRLQGKGFFQSGPDFDLIVAVAGEAETVRAARHEYVHHYLHRRARRIPPWLEEGLAELYSNAARDGASWLIGLPISNHLLFLKSAAWVPFGALERMHQDRTLWDRSAAVNLYYAQSWAFTRYLAAGSPRAGRFEPFLRRLMDGEPAAAALRAEYGQSPDDLLSAARLALESAALSTARYPAAEARSASARPRWRSLPEGEAAAFLAELAVSRTDLAADDEWLKSLSRAARNSPRGAVRSAMLALRQGDRAGAERLLRAATAAGVAEPAAWFELAMLIRDRDGTSPEVRRLLEQTVQLNPAHAEAWYLLAMSEHRAGRPGEAARMLERSVAALPRQYLFREALARVYAETGRLAEAREQARAARSAAATPDELEMAQGLLAELERASAPPPPAAPKPAVTVPRGWLEPRADGEVRGELVRVDCTGSVVFEIAAAEGLRRFRANPSSLMLKGRPQDTSFACGAQPDRPRVAARYQNPDLLVQLTFLDGQN